jgi:hypothetical protein
MNTWVLWLCRTIVLALCERVHLALTTMALRHQLAVLARSATRSQCSPVDRCVWVLLSMVWSRWQEAVTIVQPGTVRRWRRQGWRHHLRWWRGRKRLGRPAIAAEMRALIRRMSQENVLWGAPRSRANWQSSAYGSHVRPLRSTWFDGPVRRRRHGAPSCAIMPRRLSPEERMRSSPTVFRPRPLQ